MAFSAASILELYFSWSHFPVWGRLWLAYIQRSQKTRMVPMRMEATLAPCANNYCYSMFKWLRYTRTSTELTSRWWTWRLILICYSIIEKSIKLTMATVVTRLGVSNILFDLVCPSTDTIKRLRLGSACFLILSSQLFKINRKSSASLRTSINSQAVALAWEPHFFLLNLTFFKIYKECSPRLHSTTSL